MSAPAEVMVSYARKDGAAVYPVATQLSARGIRVWIDKLDLLPGDCFRTEIARAIRNCRTVLFMCSEHSLASDFCFKEIAFASSCQRPVVTLWLCPPRRMPDQYGLELGPRHQITTAGQPTEAWFPGLLQALARQGAGRGTKGQKPARDVTRLRRAALAAQTARDWRATIDAAQQALEVVPDDASLIATASIARYWLDHEQNEHFTRISSSRRAQDWAEFLRLYPSSPVADHVKRKIAQLLPMNGIEGYLTSCRHNQKKESEENGWRIAAVVCLFRLGRHLEAQTLLGEVRKTEPHNTEMTFLQVVASLHASRTSVPQANQVQAVGKAIRTVMEAAPYCGLPEMLAGIFARDFCERNRIPCPLGQSAVLLARARDKGISEADVTDWVGLLQLPAPVPPLPQPPAAPKPPPPPPRPVPTAQPVAPPPPPPPVSAAPFSFTEGPSQPSRGDGRIGKRGARGAGSKVVLWLVSGFFTVVAAGSIGVAVYFALPRSSPSTPTGKMAGDATLSPDVKLKEGDFVEFRKVDVVGEIVRRYEVVKADGRKYEARFTMNRYGVVGKSDLECDLEKILSRPSHPDPEQIKAMAQVKVNGRDVWQSAEKSEKRLRLGGEEYDCVVVTLKGNVPVDTTQETWYCTDPYVRAVLGGGTEGIAIVRMVVTTLGNQTVDEVTSARFAARK